MSSNQGSSASKSGNDFRRLVQAAGEIELGTIARRNVKVGQMDRFENQAKAHLFFPFHTEEMPEGFYVMCKRQDASGSTDKKIIYDCEMIVECFDLPTVLVIDGFAAAIITKVANEYVGKGHLFAVDSVYGFWKRCVDIAKGQRVIRMFGPSMF